MRQRLRRTTALLVALGSLQACPSPAPTTGSIELTVMNGASGSAAGAAAVTVQGTALGASTNSAGVAVLAQVPSGPQTLKVSLIGQCPTTRTVTVVAGAVTPVTVWICADVVEAAGAPDEPMIALFDIQSLRGDGTTACENDWVRQGTGTVSLATNAVPSGSCHGAVAILTPNHAFTYSNDASAMSWTEGLGDRHVVSLPAALLRVPIAIVISVGAVQDDIDAAIGSVNGVHLPNASQLLRDSYTGLELAGDESGGPIPMHTASTAEMQVIGDGCKHVDAIKASPQLYQPGRLNVYVVAALSSSGGGSAAGVSCVVEQAPEIIFLQIPGSKPFTLIHEIGHALGLGRPQWGHTLDLKGFYQQSPTEPLNVMAGTEALWPRYFSVGQVARMTLSDDSWINRPSAANGTTSRQRQTTGSVPPLMVPCACPETAAFDDCPALNTDITRSGTLQSGTTDVLACAVSVTGPVTIQCPATTRVVATLLPSGAVGSGLWVSLDPTIVTVGPDEYDSKAAILTGVKNGTGRVRAYADGSFTTFPVTVTGCP